MTDNQPELLDNGEQDGSGSVEEPETNKFPIVGIGASAGGLNAFELLFTNMPSDTGMAFVIVQHLDPTHESMLVELVQRYTTMQVLEATDGMAVEPDHVYIIPPNSDIALRDGALWLMKPEAPRGFRLPIDFFFRSLAEAQKDMAICIVLSGAGSDGTLGLKAIKGAGGLAIVQDPASAKYDRMPSNAIATDVVDFILPPEEIPEALVDYVRYTFEGGAKTQVAHPHEEQDTLLHEVFAILRAQTGHDFSQYKKNTIGRRIERRMVITQNTALEGYLRYLHEHSVEVDTLFKELLIGVTRFFREPEAFDVLEKTVIPAIFESHQPRESIRIWVPGCSTGEEAYSIAILFHEYQVQHGYSNNIQVFATDIDVQAIGRARHGIYPDSIAADVSPDRLDKYFDAQNSDFRVNEHIRQMVVFAPQNVIKDPPFSNLDLVSCRNLLIYLDAELQRRALSLFHYALRPRGFLFLGTSETVGDSQYLFETVDRKQKIFQRITSANAYQPRFGFSENSENQYDQVSSSQPNGSSQLDIKSITERYLLEQQVPVTVVIDDYGTILYTQGRTGKYLEMVTGKPSQNILDLARVGLRIPLSTAIRKVVNEHEDTVDSAVRIKLNGATETVMLSVRLMRRLSESHALIAVLFKEYQEFEELSSIVTPPREIERDEYVMILEQELQASQQHLQTVIEELETSNEELKSTNEELQSSNEELQSTNEELETTKEELQSINEELMTVNSEFEQKIEQLSHINNDMNNLLASVGIAIIFLDQNLKVQRFNPAAAELISLIEGDIGRPIQHIVPNFKYGNLIADAEHVLDTLETVEVELQTNAGHWYLMRLRPYRTVHNVVNGVIVTFTDIDKQKQAQHKLLALNNAIEQAYSIVEITGAEGRIEYVNQHFSEIMGYAPDEVQGKPFDFNRAEDFDSQAVWDTIASGKIWRGEFCSKDKKGNMRWARATAIPIIDDGGTVVRYVIVKDDITEQKNMEAQLRRSENLYRTLVRNLPDVAILVFDEDLRYQVAEGANLERSGYERKNVEGRTFYEVVPEQVRDILEPFYQAILDGEERIIKYTSANGTLLRLHGIPLTAEALSGGMIVVHTFLDKEEIPGD